MQAETFQALEQFPRERLRHEFPAGATHVIPSETFRSRNPLALAKTAGILGLGVLNAYRLLVARLEQGGRD